jgi:hypothetical protein
MAQAPEIAIRRPPKKKYRWYCKFLIRDRGEHSGLSGRTKSLLFAPRLMLERGLQFTERRSLKRPTTPDPPLLSLRGSSRKAGRSQHKSG